MAEPLLNFTYGTQAQYDALVDYDMGTLYWTTDTLALYKGDKLYNGGVKTVPTLPTSPALGVLYVLTTTWVGQIWTGSSWKVITLPFTTTINGNTPSDDLLPTEKAVVEYVSNAVANMSNTTNAFVTNISYSSNTLVVKKGVSEEYVSIDGMVHNATYNNSTRVVTLPIINGTNVEFTLPSDKDLVVKAGKYNSATEEIWLSIDPAGSYANMSNVVAIPVGDLIDEINTANSSTIDMVYHRSNNTIIGTANISAEENNALVDSHGLYVNISGKMEKIDRPDANKLVLSTLDGNVSESNYAIGATVLGSSTTNIAVESAVSNAITNSYSNSTNYTNNTNSSMKTYVDSVNSTMSNYVNAAIADAITWKTL